MQKTIPLHVLAAITLMVALIFHSCNRKSNPETTLDERCLMEHDPGPCRGAFQRYYYDREAGECKRFIYGGCEGKVPFETLEECQAACGSK